jgi:anti-anti-sigma factor
MELTWIDADGKIIVSLFERIDGNTSPSLEKALSELLNQGYTSIVLDFLKTSYVSSAGLRVLLGTAKKLPKGKCNRSFVGNYPGQGKTPGHSLGNYVQPG